MIVLCRQNSKRELLKIRIKDIGLFLGLGIGSLLLFTVCYFTTINMASLSVAAILLYTSPIWVMLMSAIGYALYSILGTFALRKYQPLTVTTYTFLCGSAGVMVFKENMTLAAVVGIVLVLGAIVVLNVNLNRKRL